MVFQEPADLDVIISYLDGESKLYSFGRDWKVRNVYTVYHKLVCPNRVFYLNYWQVRFFRENKSGDSIFAPTVNDTNCNVSLIVMDSSLDRDYTNYLIWFDKDLGFDNITLEGIEHALNSFPARAAKRLLSFYPTRKPDVITPKTDYFLQRDWNENLYALVITPSGQIPVITSSFKSNIGLTIFTHTATVMHLYGFTREEIIKAFSN